jgi:hypothetical protein
MIGEVIWGGGSAIDELMDLINSMKGVVGLLGVVGSQGVVGSLGVGQPMGDPPASSLRDGEGQSGCLCGYCACTTQPESAGLDAPTALP